MYLDDFGFAQAPFSITPDPDFLFLSHDHKEAFAHLLYGVGDTGGFVQLTGEVGTGKTTLCRYLLEKTPEEVDVALILNPRQSAFELVASICDELGVAYPEGSDSIKALIDRLNAYLLERHAQGRRTVLVIDEAQNLGADVLEQIRLLTNLETARHKLLQILLIGQPELLAVMKRPELRQLDQRITARYHLKPLSRPETIAYVEHRLAVAGCRRKLFTGPALRQVYRCSRGVPRLINIVCDRALLGAYSRGAATIGARLVREANREIMGFRGTQRELRRWIRAMPVLVLLVLGASWAYHQWPLEGPLAVLSQPEERPGKSAGPFLPTPSADEPPPPKQNVGAAAALSNPQGITAPAGLPATPSQDVRQGDIPSAVRTFAETSQEDVPLSPASPLFAHPQPAHATVGPLETVTIRADLLALAIPRENRTPVPRPRLPALLDSGRSATDAQTAYTRLFRHWQLDFDALAGITACERAASAGLQCIQKTVSFRRLVLYNRPAVLTLFDARGRVHYVTLSAVDDEQVTVDIGAQAHRFDQSEILPLWNGQCVLLWRPPLLENPILQMGSRGSDVLWLRERLARIEGGEFDTGDPARNDDFDEELRRRVIRFQQRSGLTVDGVVGERTLLHLNAALADDRTPVLTPRPKEEKR